MTHSARTHRGALGFGFALALLLGALVLGEGLGGDAGEPTAASARTAAPCSEPHRQDQGPAEAPPAPPAPPGPPAQVQAGPGGAGRPSLPETRIVVLRVGSDSVALVGSVKKPIPFALDSGPAPAGARWRLLDQGSGALLAEGPWAPPRICRCERGRDHSRGCVRVRHSAVVRLKVPHAPRTRLVLDGAGVAPATIALGDPS